MLFVRSLPGMTGNLLTINSYKTEFLFNGLKAQLGKMYNSSLNTTQSARNLGFISDEHLTFPDQTDLIPLQILVLFANSTV